jgi:hypothetical protein
MQKRGQITIFIILGIVIIVSIILVSVFKGGEVKRAVQKQIGATVGFNNEIKEVSKIVQACLEQSVKNSFNSLVLKNVDNYDEVFSEMIKAQLPSCIDFSGLNFEVATGKLRSIKVNYNKGSSKIAVKLDYDLIIKKGGASKKVSTFYTEITLTPKCCIPAKVDNNCNAKKSMRVQSCGRIFLIDKGESLEKGGECLAC